MNATELARELLSQDIAMDDRESRARTPEQAIDGWREAAATAGDLDLVAQLDEFGAEQVAAEFRRLALARREAGRSLPSWLVL